MKIHTSTSVAIRLFLWFMMIVGGAVYALMVDWGTPLFSNMAFHVVCAILGVIILKLAFNAAANGGKELAKGRIGNIPRLETNRLVTTGIFGCMRHPMLFGLTLLPLGWGLLLGSPSFIIIIAPLEMLFIVIMVILFEEKEVDKKFGKAYDVYRREVPAVSFRRECLKTLFKNNFKFTKNIKGKR